MPAHANFLCISECKTSVVLIELYPLDRETAGLDAQMPALIGFIAVEPAHMDPFPVREPDLLRAQNSDMLVLR